MLTEGALLSGLQVDFVIEVNGFLIDDVRYGRSVDCVRLARRGRGSSDCGQHCLSTLLGVGDGVDGVTGLLVMDRVLLVAQSHVAPVRHEH